MKRTNKLDYDPFSDPFNDDEQYEAFLEEEAKRQHKTLAIAIVLGFIALVVLLLCSGVALLAGS